jgi:WS/DGAT/MGAT family acyltransferase
MADVIAVKKARAATVNDVVLAIVAGAVRRALEEGGAYDATGLEPRALVPIGVRGRRTTVPGNRFSVMAVGLPVGVDDPLRRVDLVHSQMHPATAHSGDGLLAHLFSIADVIPIPVLRALVPPVLARQPLVNLAVSNIPGSREPLYLLESRMLGLSPFITGVGNIAVLIGVLSYADDLGIGVTVDPDVAGDPEVVARHVRAAAEELARLAR